MDKHLQVGQAVEIIRLKVLPENVEAFLQGRLVVDKFVSTLEGYVGTEILQANETEFVMLIRWDSEAAVVAAQKITESASVISEWITGTSQFLSFETSIVQYEN